MRQAHSTKADSPCITAKPGKLRCRWPRVAATLCIFKTTDFIHGAVGIGEGVMMRTLDRNTLRRSRNGLMALATQDVFLFFRR